MVINVNDHEDESTKCMYNDTMDMKWIDAIKAHGILKPLQHTQNKVTSIAATHFIFRTI